MIPFTQTKFVVKDTKGKTVIHGNCLQFTIASLLGFNPENVPNFETLYDFEGEQIDFYMTVLNVWLNQHGYHLNESAWQFSVLHSKDRIHETIGEYRAGLSSNTKNTFKRELKDKEYLIVGKSERGTSHICIAKNGELLHDVYPTRAGLKQINGFWEITKI